MEESLDSQEEKPPFNGWECKKCRFWDQYEANEEHAEIHAEMYPNGLGDCKRYPPTVLNTGENQRAYEYPVMTGDEGCGEFKDKDDVVKKFVEDLFPEMRIAFCDKPKAGKSTAAKFLRDNYNFKIVSFAQRIKNDCARMLASVDYPYLDVPYFLNLFEDESRKELFRALFHWRGDYIREEDPDVLLNDVEKFIYLNEKENIVVDDLRRDVEALLLKRHGFIVLRIVNEKAGLEGVDGEHPTERGISPYLIDADIDNNKSFQSMYNQLRQKMDEMREL